jgi:hypothetical protein
MKTEAIRTQAGGPWERRPDGWWQQAGLDRLRPAASALKAGGARFAALTVRPEGEAVGPEGEAVGPEGPALRLAWHWDLGGTLLSLAVKVPPGTPVPSLVDLWPGADWAEREARDYYAVDFSGRAATPPLMLREGDAPGVLLRGREAR